jgi:hypothetical protein
MKRPPVLSRATLVALLCGLGSVANLGCGTDAVGIEDCKAIELVRCEEAQACGTIDDVEACKRFYRSHCLHGLAVSSRPPRDERDDCVAALREAGACARAQGPETPLAECTDGAPAEPLPGKRVASTCDVIARPWEVQACNFLNPVASDDPGDGGGGGAGGEGGS